MDKADIKIIDDITEEMEQRGLHRHAVTIRKILRKEEGMEIKEIKEDKEGKEDKLLSCPAGPVNPFSS